MEMPNAGVEGKKATLKGTKCRLGTGSLESTTFDKLQVITWKR